MKRSPEAIRELLAVAKPRNKADENALVVMKAQFDLVGFISHAHEQRLLAMCEREVWERNQRKRRGKTMTEST